MPQPVKNTADTLVQTITASLEEDIVFGRLGPQQRLIEEDLVTRFAAKRHVVREALAELERLSLIERVPNRGAIVRLYTAREVQELNDVRQLLEGHAASLIPLPLEGSPFAYVEILARKHAKAVRAGNTVEVFRLNLAFHQAIFNCCGNRTLIDAIKTYAQKSHAYRSILTGDVSYLEWVVEDHAAIVKALRDGDRDGLIKLCHGHIRPACDRYIGMYNARYNADQLQGSSA